MQVFNVASQPHSFYVEPQKCTFFDHQCMQVLLSPRYILNHSCNKKVIRLARERCLFLIDTCNFFIDTYNFFCPGHIPIPIRYDLNLLGTVLSI